MFLSKNVSRICGTKEIVFGFEDTRGFVRNLSAYLVDRKFDVKHVNLAYISAVRLANPIIHMDNSYNAYCVARVLRDMVDSLPDVKHEDIYWTIRQLVKRRDLLMLKNENLISREKRMSNNNKAVTLITALFT